MNRGILLATAILLTCGCRTTAPGTPAPPPASGPEELASSAPATAVEPVQEETKLPLSGLPPGDDDWVLLSSNEVLRGEIIVLRTGSLEFDSNELDEQSFDIEDVLEIYTTRSIMCVLEEGTVVEGMLPLTSRKGQVVVNGPVHLTRSKVHIGAGTERQTFPRSALLTLIPGEPKEANYWSGKLGFGLDIRSGNVDQKDVNFNASAVRRTPYSRLDMSVVAAVTTVDGDDTSNNTRGNLKYDYFLSRRAYLTPFWLQYFRDPFQNISARWSPGAGAGYYIYDRSGLEWNMDLGGGVQYTKLDSVDVGEDSSETAGFARYGTRFAADITNRTDVTINYSFLQPFDGSGNYNQHFDIVVSTDLWWNLDLDVAFYWDRQGDPLEDSGGDVPEKDDYRTVVGISWEY